MDAIIDDLLIATILAGIGFGGAYLRSEYNRYRSQTPVKQAGLYPEIDDIRSGSCTNYRE
jgi:hypothetical protein